MENYPTVTPVSTVIKQQGIDTYYYDNYFQVKDIRESSILVLSQGKLTLAAKTSLVVNSIHDMSSAIPDTINLNTASPLIHNKFFMLVLVTT